MSGRFYNYKTNMQTQEHLINLGFVIHVLNFLMTFQQKYKVILIYL